MSKKQQTKDSSNIDENNLVYIRKRPRIVEYLILVLNIFTFPFYYVYLYFKPRKVSKALQKGRRQYVSDELSKRVLNIKRQIKTASQNTVMRRASINAVPIFNTGSNPDIFMRPEKHRLNTIKKTISAGYAR